MDRIYVSMTDFKGNRYVTVVEDAGGSPERALSKVARMVRQEEPIRCQITHPYNRAGCVVIFLGPVTLAVFGDSDG